MNILEFSLQLRELSDDYSQQRIILDEYRSRRKYLLDEIDQTFNNQNYVNASDTIEKTKELNDVDNVLPEAFNKVFEDDKKNGGTES